MAIPLKNLTENCCDSDLSNFSITDGDELDSVNSTCDKIIECDDKYILVEEKSILLGFFRGCCQKLGNNIDDYKYFENEVEYLKIEELIISIASLSINEKKIILLETTTKFMMTSAKKISNTTSLLCKQDGSDKTNGIITFYLYCGSGQPIDMIFYTFLSEYNKNIFFECQDLKRKLERVCA